jgi:hypothetical protein
MARNILKRRIEAGDPFLKKVHLFGEQLQASAADTLEPYLDRIHECPNIVEVSLLSFDLRRYAVFTKLATCPLHTLSLEACIFDIRVATDLSFALMDENTFKKTLKHLNLGFAKIFVGDTEIGRDVFVMAVLSPILQNIPKGLVSLSLHGINLSSERAMGHVTSLLGEDRNLSVLILTGTHLTDANANALAARGEALRDQMTLKVLEVSGNSITPIGFGRLNACFGSAVVNLPP